MNRLLFHHIIDEYKLCHITAINMTSISIIKISSIISLINDTKIFSKGENSFECGYVVNFIYLHDVVILSGQVYASMKNRLYDVKVNYIFLLIS